MLTNDPRDALVLAHEHARHLYAERAAEDVLRRRAAGTRRILAESMRRAANRLDPTPLAHRAA